MIKSFQDRTPRIHDSVFVAENAVIIGDVEIGKDASVWYNCMLRGDVNYIRIGERTNIQDATIIHVSRKTHPTVLEDEMRSTLAPGDRAVRVADVVNGSGSDSARPRTLKEIR